MFRKIVANLPFSPALVGQLGFYARRLRKEEATRRAGLIMTALALVVQSFAVFSPPEAVNAASSADFIPGGVSSKQDLLNNYDRDTGKLKSVLKSLGITRGEVQNVSKRTIGERGYYNWSRTSLYSHSQGQRSWDYGGGTVFYRPMTLTAGAKTTHAVFAGHSKIFGWFAIKIDCGNIITSKPPRAPKPAVACESLNAKRLAPTRFRLSATASKKDGARIQGFTFIVKGGGKTVSETINTNNNSASYVYQNDKPGTYRAQVIVKSSLGKKKSPDCRDTFDINTRAACQELNVTPLSRTSFRLNGKVSATKGVDIKKYTYKIYNENGRLVATKSFNSEKKSHKFVYNQNVPGKYTIRLVVRTSIGEVRGATCRDQINVRAAAVPSAVCSEVAVDVANRTIVTLSGSAQTSHGATVSKYTFTVTDSDGDVVKEVTIESSNLTVTADSFELPEGNYKAKLVVTTSLGDKSGENCEAPFRIEKQEVCPYNPSLPPNDPECQPCPDNPDIWIKDERCNIDIINTKTSSNMSQGNVNATTKIAKAGDKISYTITSENVGLTAENVTMRESLGDVLEYATLIDNGGGTFDQTNKTLAWPEVTIKPGEKQSRTFVVQMMEQIPLTNTGVSDQDSYDCKMVNTYGNSTEIKVDCAPEKLVVEQVVSELPTTGPGENMIFAGGLLAIVAYFYARSRQLSKEVRLIRKSAHAGAI